MKICIPIEVNVDMAFVDQSVRLGDITAKVRVLSSVRQQANLRPEPAITRTALKRTVKGAVLSFTPTREGEFEVCNIILWIYRHCKAGNLA